MSNPLCIGFRILSYGCTASSLFCCRRLIHTFYSLSLSSRDALPTLPTASICTYVDQNSILSFLHLVILHYNFMEMATISSSPRTVEEIFKDYTGRRAGIVRALTYDVDDFYSLCDPEKENLCLYGHPNENWEVALPAEEVPPELPEPALGINFARDGMGRRDWLSLVAVHSDCWLLSVAFYLGARLNWNERKRLFNLINDLPTVFEVVTERKPLKEKPSADSGSKSRGSTKRTSEGQAKSNAKLPDENFEEDEDEHSETLCGSCGGNYNGDEFWIGCDVCERWYHGKCVKITPAKAESIKQYKCPSCSMKRGRQ